MVKRLEGTHYSDNCTIHKANHNGHERLKNYKNHKNHAKRRNNQRIAQVSFQARLSTSSVTTTARSGLREIQNNN